MTRPAHHRVRDRMPGRAGPWALLVAAEAALVVGYFAATPAEPRAVRYLVYPFVWTNVGLWAVARTRPAPASDRHRLVAGLLAGAYFVAVMAIPGNVGLSAGAPVPTLRVGWYAPGWGPLVAYAGPWLRLYLVPFEVVGYAALAYLVYAAALDVARAAAPGALAAVTCVGCTVPVVVPLAGLVGGPTTGLATTAYRFSYDLGTVVFVATVGLLYAGLHPGWQTRLRGWAKSVLERQ